MTAAQAQVLTEAQVPPPVVAAFQKSFPGAPVKWEKGVSSTYEATFKKETSVQVYVYDQAGVLQLKKQRSTLTQMPASVQQSVSASHPGATQTQAYKVISRTQEKYFEVIVAQATGSERLRFDLEGNPVGNTNVAAATPATKPAVATAPAPKPAAATTPPAPSPSPKPAVATTPAPKPAAATPPPAPSPTPKPAVATAPAPKPAVTAPTPAPAPKPAVAATTPAPKPASVAPKPAPVAQPAIAMRGDNATTTVKPAKVDEDMDIDMDEDIDVDMLDEEDTFEDIDGLLEDHDDDSDLLLEEDDDDWLELDDDDDKL